MSDPHPVLGHYDTSAVTIMTASKSSLVTGRGSEPYLQHDGLPKGRSRPRSCPKATHCLAGDRSSIQSQFSA